MDRLALPGFLGDIWFKRGDRDDLDLLLLEGPPRLQG